MPQSNSVFGLVEKDFQQHRYTSAMMKLVSLSNTHSKDLGFLALLAQAQKALADFTGLIKTLQVAAEITKSATDRIQLMTLLYSQGRLNEALDVALLLQEMTLPPAEAKMLSHCLVKIFVEFSDYEGLQEVISFSENAINDDVLLWANGLVHLSNGEKNDALDSFRKAVLVNNLNDQAWVSLSILHEEMGDRELAMANLERALDANPHNSVGLKLMTKWYRRDAEQTANMMNKVRHYLAQYEFDEEISLCHLQMLKEANDLGSARFEAEKLFLNYPANSKYASMKSDLKKMSEDGMKTQL